MTNQLADVVKELAEKQVGFYATHDHPHGQATVPLSSQEVIRYAVDPVGYLAEHYRVSREDYLAWHRSGYKVICSGFTKTGKPCKGIVRDLSMVTSPALWVQGQGGRCTTHG
ncbi:hypothetical protein [Burkholderia stabilis]|jgi:hypothetical protein|uniref:hypothetical protein n=1 Tax=Burkholderia stabilis TaxID=95485 RepID=UPI0015925B5B|nr:hypothetical protein [Burkholderia stabilis]